MRKLIIIILAMGIVPLVHAQSFKLSLCTSEKIKCEPIKNSPDKKELCDTVLKNCLLLNGKMYRGGQIPGLPDGQPRNSSLAIVPIGGAYHVFFRRSDGCWEKIPIQDALKEPPRVADRKEDLSNFSIFAPKHKYLFTKTGEKPVQVKMENYQ